MKNQFFGDSKDLFKFDLVERILGVSELRRFTFVAMLTPDDEVEYKESQTGGKNEKLNQFLTLKKRGCRNIHSIKEHFNCRDVETLIYCREFHPEDREAYFEEIPKAWLSYSLILLDPDNGLEPKKPDEKHVRYKEVEGIYSRMEKSILMIFQYRPQRQTWEECIQEKLDGLKKEIKESLPILHIRDGTLAFFFLVKNPNLHDALKRALEAYKECYRLKGITS